MKSADTGNDQRSDAPTDARIDELEMRIAHQDQTVHELGNEVYRQQRQIAELESIVRELAARLAAAEDDRAEAGPAADRPVHEVPPHY